MLEQNFTKLRSLTEDPYVCGNHSAEVLVTLVGFVKKKKKNYKILDWICNCFFFFFTNPTSVTRTSAEWLPQT